MHTHIHSYIPNYIHTYIHTLLGYGHLIFSVHTVDALEPSSAMEDSPSLRADLVSLAREGLAKQSSIHIYTIIPRHLKTCVEAQKIALVSTALLDLMMCESDLSPPYIHSKGK